MTNPLPRNEIDQVFIMMLVVVVVGDDNVVPTDVVDLRPLDREMGGTLEGYLRRRHSVFQQ